MSVTYPFAKKTIIKPPVSDEPENETAIMEANNTMEEMTAVETTEPVEITETVEGEKKVRHREATKSVGPEEFQAIIRDYKAKDVDTLATELGLTKNQINTTLTKFKKDMVAKAGEDEVKKAAVEKWISENLTKRGGGASSTGGKKSSTRKQLHEAMDSVIGDILSQLG